MTHEMFILGMAAHLCKFPSVCAFNDFSKVNNIQDFINGMQFVVHAIKSQVPNCFQYRDWTTILNKLSSLETLDNGKSFQPKKDYTPYWTHAQATACWLELQATEEAEPIERLRETCRLTWRHIKDRYELESVWGFGYWVAFFSEIDCSAFFSLDDDKN